MKLNDKWYNVLKWIALVVLPAVGTFYTALTVVWGLPYTGEITGTILAVETFIGALIGISTATYNKDNKNNQ